MKTISIKAVVISSIVSFALMLVFIAALGASYAALHAEIGSRQAVADAFANSWICYAALVAPVIAGFLGAHLAKRRAVLHGALSASLNMIWGIFCLIAFQPVQPAALIVLALNPLLGMLGGYLWLKSSQH
jgi:hypothetical protein